MSTGRVLNVAAYGFAGVALAVLLAGPPVLFAVLAGVAVGLRLAAGERE